jgi:hypothetical protein
MVLYHGVGEPYIKSYRDGRTSSNVDDLSLVPALSEPTKRESAVPLRHRSQEYRRVYETSRKNSFIEMESAYHECLVDSNGTVGRRLHGLCRALP